MAADERFEGSRDREIHIHCSDVIVKKMREYRLHY